MIDILGDPEEVKRELARLYEENARLRTLVAGKIADDDPTVKETADRVVAAIASLKRKLQIAVEALKECADESPDFHSSELWRRAVKTARAALREIEETQAGRRAPGIEEDKP